MKLMFRVDEVAKILAVSPKTVYRMLEDGELIGLKINKGAMRIRADVLAAYVDRKSQMFVLENGFNFTDRDMVNALPDITPTALLT